MWIHCFNGLYLFPLHKLNIYIYIYNNNSKQIKDSLCLFEVGGFSWQSLVGNGSNCGKPSFSGMFCYRAHRIICLALSLVTLLNKLDFLEELGLYVQLISRAAGYACIYLYNFDFILFIQFSGCCYGLHWWFSSLPPLSLSLKYNFLSLSVLVINKVLCQAMLYAVSSHTPWSDHPTERHFALLASQNIDKQLQIFGNPD